MIRVNDRWEIAWAPGMVAQDVLSACQFTHHYVAVSINGTLIAPELVASFPVQDGDDVRVIHIIGGG